MADSKFTDLVELASGDIDTANDVLAVDDVSVPETKKVTVASLVAAGVLNGLTATHVNLGTMGAAYCTEGLVRGGANVTAVGLGSRNSTNTANVAAVWFFGNDVHYGGDHGSGRRATNIAFTATTQILFRPAATSIFDLRSTGVQFGGGSPDFGGGSKVFGIDDCTTAPTTNPTAGGILYSEAGAGKWRGSGGTVTTFGPAEPHCPTCGRDFALEHKNESLGEHFAICIPCMIDEVVKLGADASKFAITDSRSRTKAEWDAHMMQVRAKDEAARVLEAQIAELERIASLEEIEVVSDV